jgi:serine protease AprX
MGLNRVLTALALPAALAATLLVPQHFPGAVASAVAAPQRRVIVRADSNDLSGAELAVRRAGGRVERTLGIIDAVAATVPADALAALRSDPVVREVTANSAVTLAGVTGGSYAAQDDTNSLYNIERTVGARQLWSRGVTGRGVGVALIDSGVAQVPGIDGSHLVEGPDLTAESTQPGSAHVDRYGHGTHLAGIIAGRDDAVTDVTQAADDSTDFLGVAPDARIVSVKVADGNGVSDVSQVIAGIDWVVQHARQPGLNIRVINLSFGTDSAQTYILDPLAFAAEQAWKHGIVVVVSAGNTGASTGRMTDPAIDPYVLAVGAVDTHGSSALADDTVPSFSSNGDGVRNPDLLAPGVHVQSLRVPGSYADVTYGSTGALADRYFRGSGTSQAAAVISGAVALLLQRSPWLTPDQIKYALTGNARVLPKATVQAQGAGLLSLADLPSSVPSVRQYFPPSRGVGSLDAARGSARLVGNTENGSITLSGEQDVMGQAVDTRQLAQQEALGTSWTGGNWNGRAWTASGWASSSWASSSWASSSWASSSWASSSWASSSWASSSWASSSWAATTWS